MSERKQMLRKMFHEAELEISDRELAVIDEAQQLVSAWVPAFYTLYSSRLLEKSNKKLAESNDRYANKMTRLTIALLIVAAVEAVATAVSALIAAGIIGH